MISVEQILAERYPQLQQHPLRYSFSLKTLSALLYEKDFQGFAEQHPHLRGAAFIEQVFSELNVSYRVSEQERERIPSQGRVLIVANHPVGSLDGLALLHLVNKLRPDVKIVANELLSTITPLSELLLPVDNMSGNSQRKQLQAIKSQLASEGAVIMFPAGEVSRLKGITVRDGKWNKGFIRMAQKTHTPVLPVCVKAKNSKLFYLASMLYKPLSTLLLVREMFAHRNHVLGLRVGEMLPARNFIHGGLDRNTQAQLVKKHVYRIGAKRKGLFLTEAAIAHPEDRQQLRQEVKRLACLGQTPDGKQIFLCRNTLASVLLSELGRLRELSFRSVGEGSGRRSDTDKYDADYMHLLLWDDEGLEIAGAYRFADTQRLLEQKGLKALYSQSLFDYDIAQCGFLQAGLELGRSFVQPKYWGKRSLDYLWLGIGAFLAKNPQYRYLFGPVSLSASMPAAAHALLIRFYRLYFPASSPMAKARQPYTCSAALSDEWQQLFTGDDYKQDFAVLKATLASMGTAIPTLYKQYTELCNEGGVQFIDFNVDPAFHNCVDGLVLVDLHYLKPKKQARYIQVHHAKPACDAE